MNTNILQNAALTLIIMLFATVTISAQWVQVASPPANFITDHSYGFALDGKGYLVTGTDQFENVRNDFYQYDPVTDEFSRLEDFPGGARGFAIGDTWNGKAYFGFGSSINFRYNDLWEYDASSETWTELAVCPCRPRTHPALIAHNDKVFVGLGSSSAGDQNDWWIYDIATDSWTQGAGFPAAQRHHPYQFAIGDFIYVGFGHGGSNIYNTWYRYDPSDDTWVQVQSLPGEGRVAGQQFSWNDKGYILSGEGEDHAAMVDGEFWSYDPILDSWDQLPSHPSYSRWAPASFVIDNEVYLFNGVVYGFGPTEYISEAYKFDLAAPISSTETIDMNRDISTYPNPASDYLIIENKNKLSSIESFSLFDILGNKLMDFDIDGKKELKVSGLESGIYLLGQEGGSSFSRVVINR